MLYLSLHCDTHSFIVYDIEYGYIAYLIIPMNSYVIVSYSLSFMLLFMLTLCKRSLCANYIYPFWIWFAFVLVKSVKLTPIDTCLDDMID